MTLAQCSVSFTAAMAKSTNLATFINKVTEFSNVNETLCTYKCVH